MIHKPLTLLLSLFFLVFVLKPVFGDEGRDGGIVVLPNTMSAFDGGVSSPIACYAFGAGEDVKLQLPAELNKAIVITEFEGMVATVGSLSGRVLIVRAEELACLSAAGIQSFVVRIIGSDGRGFVLTFRLLADGRVRLLVA